MRRIWWAALCAVAACAGQGTAAIMEANIDGYLVGTDTLGIFGFAGQQYTDELPQQLPTATYDITVIFDTSLGTLQNLVSPGGQAYQILSWSAAGGGSSPVISATIQTEGSASHFVCSASCQQGMAPPITVNTSGSANYDLSAAQSFSIGVIPDEALHLQLTASDGSISGGYSEVGSLGGEIDQPFTDDNYRSGGVFQMFSVGDYPGMYETQLSETLTVLGPSPTPEPSTWAMLLIGFAGLGTMMRRRRSLA